MAALTMTLPDGVKLRAATQRRYAVVWTRDGKAHVERRSDSLATARAVYDKHGMRVWDSNLRPGTVDLSRLNDEGWFNVSNDGGGQSFMNAARVCVMHPHTRERVPA